MELDKGCNNLRNLYQINSDISQKKQINSNINGYVAVSKAYKGEETDDIIVIVDNTENTISAVLKMVDGNRVDVLLKSDTLYNWYEKNPVLKKGEIGLVSDTTPQTYKIGDGETDWRSLPNYAHIDYEDAQSLAILADMLDKDDFGKVDDVHVNGESVVSNKVADISIGTLTFTSQGQSLNPQGEKFSSNITLHRVAKTGSYKDLLDRLNVVDNLDSESSEDVLSANQGNVLFKMVKAIPQGRSFSTINALVTALNGYIVTELNVGSNLYVQALNVPDFWVYSVEATNVPYSYTTDQALIDEINSKGSVKIGYYRISKLETDKVDLTDYVKKEYLEDNYYNKKYIDDIENRINDIDDDVVHNIADIYDNKKSIDELRENKQDALTAGENITIKDNVISAIVPDKMSPASETILGGIRAWIDEEGYICFSTYAFENYKVEYDLYINGAVEAIKKDGRLILN